MNKETRDRLLKETNRACSILQKIWTDVCQRGTPDDVRAADEAYRRAAMLRDHLENAA